MEKRLKNRLYPIKRIPTIYNIQRSRKCHKAYQYTQKEIADLRSGKLQAEAGKTVESAIKAKEQELQSAEKTLETLTGVSHKSGNKKVVDSQQNLSDELLQLIRANQQEEINLMEEGSEKSADRLNWITRKN